MFKMNAIGRWTLLLLTAAPLLSAKQYPDLSLTRQISPPRIDTSIKTKLYGPHDINDRSFVVLGVIADTSQFSMKTVRAKIEDQDLDIEVKARQLIYHIGLHHRIPHPDADSFIRDIGAMIYRYVLQDSVTRYYGVLLHLYLPDTTLTHEWRHDEQFMSSIDTFPGKTYQERLDLYCRWVTGLKSIDIFKTNMPDMLVARLKPDQKWMQDTNWLKEKGSYMFYLFDGLVAPKMDTTFKKFGVFFVDEAGNNLYQTGGELHSQRKRPIAIKRKRS